MVPSLSAIVVNYRTGSCLEACLEAILESDFDGELEVILVNNSPEDGSSDMVSARFPGIRIIDSEVNLGFGPANNVAAEAARGQVLLLVNPDAYVPKDAIQKAYDYLMKRDDIAAVGPQFVNLDGVPQPSARMFPTVLDKLFVLSGLSARFPRSRIFGRVDQTWRDHETPHRVDWVVGAFMMIKKQAWLDLDGFDPRFFLYFEELDLCRRLASAGLEVHYLPNVVVVHQGGASSSEVKSEGRVGKQLTLLRLFSEALYYGKYYGVLGPLIMLGLERWWLRFRYVRNRWKRTSDAALKRERFRHQLGLIKMALAITKHGRHCPPHPWSADLESYQPGGYDPNRTFLGEGRKDEV